MGAAAVVAAMLAAAAAAAGLVEPVELAAAALPAVVAARAAAMAPVVGAGPVVAAPVLCQAVALVAALSLARHPSRVTPVLLVAAVPGWHQYLWCLRQWGLADTALDHVGYPPTLCPCLRHCLLSQRQWKRCPRCQTTVRHPRWLARPCSSQRRYQPPTMGAGSLRFDRTRSLGYASEAFRLAPPRSKFASSSCLWYLRSQRVCA